MKYLTDSYWQALRLDLKKHLIVGNVAAFVVTLGLGYVLVWHSPLSLGLALGIAVLTGFVTGERLGWLKEYFWDAKGRGTVDRQDYLFTGRGAAMGASLGFLLVLIGLWMGM